MPALRKVAPHLNRGPLPWARAYSSRPEQWISFIVIKNEAELINDNSDEHFKSFMLLSKNFKTLVSFLIVFSLLLILVGQTTWAATGVDNALGNLDVTANKGGIQSSTTDLPTIIGRVIGVALALVGVIFFLLILWAGFGWMLAQGDEEKVKQAKETIITATLGLIVIFGAYAITVFISSIFSQALKN